MRRTPGERVIAALNDLIETWVELKCVERLASEHTAQCLNYLRASGKSLCLFG